MSLSPADTVPTGLGRQRSRLSSEDPGDRSGEIPGPPGRATSVLGCQTGKPPRSVLGNEERSGRDTVRILGVLRRFRNSFADIIDVGFFVGRDSLFSDRLLHETSSFCR
jgi:hypothetical protein